MNFRSCSPRTRTLLIRRPLTTVDYDIVNQLRSIVNNWGRHAGRGEAKRLRYFVRRDAFILPQAPMPRRKRAAPAATAGVERTVNRGTPGCAFDGPISTNVFAMSADQHSITGLLRQTDQIVATRNLARFVGTRDASAALVAASILAVHPLVSTQRPGPRARAATAVSRGRALSLSSD